jgi:TolB-like protein/DNA-binding winged helix-turn-helix (wHTH) protein
MSESQYRFAEFQLDCASFELRRQGRAQKSERISLERIPMELLILLLERQGSVVTRQEIVDRLWGKDVFVDTEHGINTAIRKVRQALRDDPEQPRFVLTISGKGYRFVAERSSTNGSSGIAAPATEAVVPPQPPATPAADLAPASKPRFRLAAVTALILLVVAGILIAVNAGRMRVRLFPSTQAAQIHSIAVLPLSNLSGDSSQDYFADGMTDEITTKLSKIQGINIASHSAVVAAKGGPTEIGKALGVRYVLEGSVRKAGDEVRVNVHLIDANSGFQVWADDFTGEMKDVFSLQEQTALKIAQSLNLKLTPQEQQAIQKRYTQNPQAYDAYLRGSALVASFDQRESLETARKNFELALRLDPDYAPAIAGLAWVEGQIYRNLEPNPEHLLRAENYARRALAIDPNLSEAHIAMGTVYSDKYDYLTAAREYRTAADLDPNSGYAADQLSRALGYQQPPDANGAEAAARKAIRLHASLYPAYYHLGRALLLQKRYDEALAAFDQMRQINRGASGADLGVGQVYLAQGEYDKAVKALTANFKPSGINYYWLGAAYAAKGDRTRALDTIQKAFQSGFADFGAIDNSAYFASLKSGPRFQQLILEYKK